MSLQDRMETDVLWVKSNNHLEWGPRARTHGYSYLYYNVPNFSERIEMIYRSMGKQYDWELEKFRLAKKFPDRGNKKRMFKNLFRFIKNPFGVIYWRLLQSNRFRFRFLLVSVLLGSIATLWGLKKESIARQGKAHYEVMNGKSPAGLPNESFGNGNNKGYYQQMFITDFHYNRATPNLVVMNPVWKQAFRKEFGLLNAYNVRV